ncbi:MAG: hypothetical protein ACOYNS_02260 [Bacteroidota bacterium]
MLLRFTSFLTVLLLVFGIAPVFGQSLYKTADDDGSKYTNIGNIGITITNFGTIGNRFLTRPVQPSAQYPKGSSVEHISLAGLWIGAISQKDGIAHVSTAATDVNPSAGQSVTLGYELTNEPGAGIKQRSSLPFDQSFDLNAVSHQDFVMDFTDKNRRSGSDTIPEHTPLGVNVHLESYAWNFPFADNFVLLNYTIKNIGTDTLQDVYVGLWDNAIVQNLNLSGASISAHMGKSFLDSLRMMYTFDYNGAFITSTNQRTVTNTYIGMKLLGSTPFPRKDSSNGQYYFNKTIDSLGDLSKNTFYNAWQFNSQSNSDSKFWFPLNDDAKYQRLKASLPKGHIEALNRANGTTSSNGTNGQAPSSYIDLLSAGPFATMKPGDSIQVSFAIVAAKKFGTALTTDDYLPTTQLRRNLVSGAGWAQKAYDGEDVNGNNKLDPNEDADGNGKITRFTLPQPPRQPKVRTVVENQQAIIYWDNIQSEMTPDPITHKLDFEGYRIYRSNAGADIGTANDFLLSMQLVGEFDRADDNIGYNTGFNKVKLPSPKIFSDDTTKYWYRYPPADDHVTNLNGWQYLYGISAYDQGDSSIGVEPLESAKVIKRVVTGTLPTSNASDEIGVYPNPYYSNAAWDQNGERSRKIYFYNLPAVADIKIYTMTGDLVAEIHHDAATYNGTGIKWFNDFSGIGVPAQMSGGEHAWDLISKFDQAIATGLYLFTVKDASNGAVKRGKFVIVK